MVTPVAVVVIVVVIPTRRPMTVRDSTPEGVDLDLASDELHGSAQNERPRVDTDLQHHGTLTGMRVLRAVRRLGRLRLVDRC